MRPLPSQFSVTITGEHAEGNARAIYAQVDSIPDQLRQVGVRVSGLDVAVGFERADGTVGYDDQEPVAVETLAPAFDSAALTIADLRAALPALTDAVALRAALEAEPRKGARAALEARLAELEA